ncbi:putative multi-domain containing protein [Aduncisulcus paluster]|uniref:Multi-domain containing protein n=1 Tax=Aduncisulcus paluster TaxID=2918883 RepID=A0ABQ5JXZ4_9EUKA|nr:putative multi-domain containing protein [Aduncisulcus paluster]
MSRLLKKEEEVDVEVLNEDQQKINRFSILVDKYFRLKEEIEKLSGRIETYKTAADELMIADGDVYFVVGQSFVQDEDAEELLEEAIGDLQKKFEGKNDEIAEVKSEMASLKSILKGKFGASIGLDFDE